EGLEEPAPGARQALEGPLVELDQYRPDRCVQLFQAIEALMPQARQDPATGQQYGQLRAALVLGPVRSRRDHYSPIVGSELLVRALQLGLVAIGARDADFGVIRNEDRRGRPVILERPHVAGEPVR